MAREDKIYYRLGTCTGKPSQGVLGTCLWTHATRRGMAVPEQTVIGLPAFLKIKDFFILLRPYCNFEINFTHTKSMSVLI